MKSKFVVLIFLVLIITFFLTVLFSSLKKGGNPQVCFENNCFNVELAITPKERSDGLMFREELESDKGMLFIFEEEGNYPFWMENTLIPLDIIWISKNKEVVFISKNTQPCKISPCPVINPKKFAKYVLEINGGVSEIAGLNEEDLVELINI